MGISTDRPGAEGQFLERTVTDSVISMNSKDPPGLPLGYARRFQDLVVCRKARVLAKDVFSVSGGFPREEAFSLTDQVRRSSRSVGGQIAEAWAKRRYPNHFRSKLTDADGEQNETQHWLTIAFDCGYLSAQETRRPGELCLEVGRMLGEMIRQAEQFCQSDDFLREPPPDFRFSEDSTTQPPTTDY